MHCNFPIGEQAHWRSNLQTTPIISQWLFDPLSLTAKLKKHSSEFRLEVLGEVWLLPEQFSQLNFNEATLVREVLLFCQGKPWVYAHSQIPESTIAAGNQILQNLGETPLGEQIFKHKDIQRTQIEVAEFGKSNKVYQLAESFASSTMPEVLVGRRSMFSLANKPLTVSEVFLADCYFYHE